MRILMVTDRMGLGGVETHVASLASELAERGVETEVLSLGGETADLLAHRGIPQHRFSALGREPISLLRAARMLDRLQEARHYEVIHAHSRLSAGLLRLLRGERRPLRVVTVHAAYRSTATDRLLSYWGDRTLAVSEDLRAHVCDRFGVPAEAVRVIPNGVDVSAFTPGERPPAGSVLFASRLDRDCSLGAHLLLTLAPTMKRVFPQLTLTVAGGGEELELLKWRAARAERSYGARFIHFAGGVSDMAPLYRRHRIFVGVSRAAMEAAASGCAVILCGNEGMGGYLERERRRPSLTNFCCRGMEMPTPRRLAALLAPLLAHPGIGERLGEEGCEWIREEYSSAEAARAYLDFLKEAQSLPK